MSRLNIGDLVRVVAILDAGPEGLIGQIGTVTEYTPFEEHPYIVTFGIDNDMAFSCSELELVTA